MNKTFDLNTGDKITYRPSGPGRDKTAYVILVEEFFVLVSTADPRHAYGMRHRLPITSVTSIVSA